MPASRARRPTVSAFVSIPGITKRITKECKPRSTVRSQVLEAIFTMPVMEQAITCFDLAATILSSHGPCRPTHRDESHVSSATDSKRVIRDFRRSESQYFDNRTSMREAAEDDPDP